MVIAVDYSLSASTLLRESTKRAHESVENTQGAVWLASGKLPKEEYVRFLVMLWHIYDALERGLQAHASDPLVSSVWTPLAPVVSRADTIAADIVHLLHLDETSAQTRSWLSHPTVSALLSSPPPGFTEYINRINRYSDPDSSSSSSFSAPRALAHAYVRYLGDLSGGQIIRQRITKAYALDRADGRGIAFYRFGTLESPDAVAGPSDLRRIKEQFRRRLDESVGGDQKVKAVLIEEANLAFRLNEGLFSALQGPTAEDQDAPKVVYDNTKAPSSSAPLVSVSTVISFIMAASLAHFILVVTGFTGTAGSVKYKAFEDWLFGGV
ncbi:heme oxygenase-like protein [Coniophora puteana RWD-64-598 SS2]|uniref:Heme oxygenase-like protein n=1 Tax=Coniophora puteana (strain RWD-64-598) TaxID=741705 RepID=R7SEV6_CONPW|nr:heme oxygenase-like protein [Coniophora puteana RWD-64-598 SS2]EIW74696.1 heme oxygenase-like protein [Coniophora puteana RWD-64-598 SS2]